MPADGRRHDTNQSGCLVLTPHYAQPGTLGTPQPPGRRSSGIPAAENRQVFSGIWYTTGVANWTFLTNHARVLLCVAHDPGARLRDIAAALDITERGAFGIITDLIEAGYIDKEKDGRRNRYRIQAHLPPPEPTGREHTVGEVLALLAGTDPIEM